jgi:hypothetical protein
VRAYEAYLAAGEIMIDLHPKGSWVADLVGLLVSSGESGTVWQRTRDAESLRRITCRRSGVVEEVDADEVHGSLDLSSRCLEGQERGAGSRAEGRPLQAQVSHATRGDGELPTSRAPILHEAKAG